MWPSSVVVLRDTNEHDGLDFPPLVEWLPPGRVSQTISIRVQVENVRLLTGDYTLKGYENVMAVEKKSGLVELAQNLASRDSARFFRAIKRLASLRHKWVVVTDSLQSMGRASRYVKSPAAIMDRLVRVSLRWGIPLWWVPRGNTIKSEHACSEVIARLLLTAAFGPSSLSIGGGQHHAK